MTHQSNNEKKKNLWWGYFCLFYSVCASVEYVFRWFSHVKDVTAPCKSAWLQVRNVLKCPQICTVINALSITVTVCLHVLVYHLISCAVKSKLYHSIPLTYSASPHRLMGFCSPMNCGWVWLSTAWLVFFPLTSTSLSTTQSSILREPLSLDLCNLTLAS